MPSLWDSLAGLDLRVEGYSTRRVELAMSPEFTRVTTTVVVEGAGETGQGEDVTYTTADHEAFPVDEELAGSWTLESFSRRLDDAVLWAAPPKMGASTDYRRWAFESAGLDLALRQAGVSFAQAVGRSYEPVRFVASTRRVIEPYLELNPALEFKLDVAEDWDAPLMERLAGYDRVRVLDMKAYYRGTAVDLAPDPELYRAVVRHFPGVVIEDAWLEDGCREALAGAEDRLSFDAPIHSWADVEGLPLEIRWLNIKPSRFGTVRRLLDCIDEAERRGIRLYGGGQTELGVGRRQIQRLASTFYADEPNDVAPSEYNDGPARPGLATSPLPAPDGVGFG